MPQWDYRKIDLNDLPRRKDDIDLLIAAGEDGWELIAITPNNFAYLKRRFETAGAQETSSSVRSTRRRITTNAKRPAHNFVLIRTTARKLPSTLQ